MGVRRERMRWLAPLAAVAVVACVAGVDRVVAQVAPVSVSLPSADAASVLAHVLEPDDTSWSGQVLTHVDLGLPAGVRALLGGPAAPLQAAVGAAAAVPSDVDDLPLAATPAGVLGAVLTADSKVRVWVDGADLLRAQIVQPLDELDVVHAGRQWWTYSARDDQAVHVLAAGPAGGSNGTAGGTASLVGAAGGLDFSLLTPQGLAAALLPAVAEDSTIALAEPQLVDGREAYTLHVVPRSSDTLVRWVDVAVDAETGLALRVQVADASGEAGLDTRLTRLDLGRPDPSLFAFTPSAGTRVVDWELPATSPRVTVTSGAAKVRGTAWDAVVRLDADQDGNPLLAWHGVSWSRLGALGARVSGGHVLRTRLGTVLVTDDGRAYAGAVAESLLLARAAADAAGDARATIEQEYVPPVEGDGRT